MIYYLQHVITVTVIFDDFDRLLVKCSSPFILRFYEPVALLLVYKKGASQFFKKRFVCTSVSAASLSFLNGMEHNPAEPAGGVAIDGEGGSAAATVCAAGAGRAARGVLGRGQ